MSDPTRGRFRRALLEPANRGLATSAAAFSTTVLIQVATIPAFLTGVGRTGLADWLLLTAVPSYLSLADLGFSGAAVTLATHALGIGDERRANAILNSAWMIVSAIAAVVGIALVAMHATVLGWLGLRTLSDHAALTVLTLQAAVVFGSVQMSFIEGAFRAAGRFPTGMAFIISGRLLEFVSIIIVLLVLHGGLLWAAVAQVLIRILIVAISYITAVRIIPWYKLHPKYSDGRTLQSIISPSLTYSGYTFGFALLNQGFTIVVGRTLGANSLVTFTTVRTLVNVIQQVTVVLAIGLLPELTKAIAGRDWIRGRDLFRRQYKLTLALVSPACVVLIILGPTGIAVWTSGQVVASSAFVALMTLTTLADVPWRIDTNLLRAANKHQLCGLLSVLSCALCLIASVPLMTTIGLIGAAAALFIVDLILVPAARLQARRAIPVQ